MNANHIMAAAAATFGALALGLVEPAYAADATPTPGASAAPTPVMTIVPATATPAPVMTPPGSVTNETPPPAAFPSAPATLSLSDAEKIALASSPQLAISRAAINQATAGVDIARSAQQPNVSAQASSDRSKASFRASNDTTGGTVGATSSSSLVTSNNASVNLRQLIIDGGRVAAQVASARFSTDAARLGLVRDIQTVILTVAQEYYAALQSRHQLQAARQSLSVAQVQERLVQAQFRAGVAARADVLTAQLPVAQAQLAVAQALNGEASNLAALLATIGVPAQAPVTLTDDTSVSRGQAPLDQILQTSLAQRADLLAANANLRAAQENVRSARLGRFPVLAGTASDGVASTTPSGGNFGNSYSVGVALSFPILDGGLIRAQTALAQAQADSAQANLQTAELNVRLNVQQAYLGVSTASAGLTAANAELDQARVVLSVTNAQYRAGVTTLPLLLNAQNQLTKAQSDQVNALYTYKTAQQQLLYAEGILSP